MATKPKLDVDLSGNPIDQTDYHSKIWSLMYLTSSRPDMVQAVWFCARYQSRPTKKHLKEVKRIFRYLRGTVNMGRWYPKGSGFGLTTILDADHARCIDTRKSTSGGIQFLGDKLVSWMLKKQNCTAMSSAEAKYVELSVRCAQVMWMRTQLQDYGFNYNKIPLYCDSQSAISISCNLVQHSRTKHIHTRYHFIKEQVENGIFELYFVRTEYQLADMFTKALPEDRFKYLVRRIDHRWRQPDETTPEKEATFPDLTSGQISLGLDLTYAPSTITTRQPSEGELDLLFEAMYDDFIGGQPSAAQRTVPAAQPQQVHLQSKTVADNVPNAMFDANTFVNPFANPYTTAVESSSSQNVDPSNMHMFYQPYPHEFQWTKDHPLEQVIGEPSRPVLTRNQLRSDGDMCMYALTVSTMEPKNVKEAMTDPAWIESMQEELLQIKRLDVYVLVSTPDNISPLTLKWLFKNKHDEEKTVIRNKSQLVMRGYRQEEGIDFEESFAPDGSYQDILGICCT
nr:copia protein [Tanacetum cinerariifolium]